MPSEYERIMATLHGSMAVLMRRGRRDMVNVVIQTVRLLLSMLREIHEKGKLAAPDVWGARLMAPMLIYVLTKSEGNIHKTARTFGIARGTLYSRLAMIRDDSELREVAKDMGCSWLTLRMKGNARLRGMVFTSLLTLAACTAFTGYPPHASEVTLEWTATGDDGNVGTATEYDLRYARDSITDATWDFASRVPGLPAPDSAGTPQSFTVTGLAGGLWYFAIKVRDEAGNWSPLSNIAKKQIDVIAPAAIVDLRAR